MGNRLDGLGGAAAQGVNADDVATAHVGQQGADGGQLRADGDVDLPALHQVDVGRVVDQGHHLARAQALGQQRGHDVGFIVVGQGQEDVGVGDALFQQQVAVRGTALQHDGAFQAVGQVAAAGRITLDDLHLVTAFDGLGQAFTDVAAAGDDDAFVAVFQAAHLAHHRADMALGGDEEDFVVGLDHRIALGQNRPIATEDRRHTGVDVRHVGAQLAQLLAHQRPAVVGAHRHQLGFALGKVEHLQGAGVFDQALDVVGHHLLGADQHVHRDGVVVEQVVAGQVGRFAHPSNFGRGVEQGVGDLAGEHVDFVTVGHRNQHVGVIRAGLAQHGGERATADHGTDVQTVAEVAQALGVGVYHGDVVGLAGQVFRQRAADLAGTENDDLHCTTPVDAAWAASTPFINLGAPLRS